jgi:hypothetical protein
VRRAHGRRLVPGRRPRRRAHAARVPVPAQAQRRAPALSDPTDGIRAALALYHAGKPFEAHELLEVQWHAAGRSGDDAQLLKALIKLCAARVKLERDHNVGGVRSHAEGARALLDDLAARTGASERLGVRFDDVRAELARLSGAAVPP